MRIASKILFIMVTICVGTVGAQVPAAPKSARVRIIDDSRLQVTVEPPLDDGGSAVTHYNVKLSLQDKTKFTIWIQKRV